MLSLVLVVTAPLVGACSSDDDASDAGEPSGTQTASGASSNEEAATDDIRYYGNNLFAIGSFTATPEDCEDHFGGAEPETPLAYWDAVTPSSCYQEGAMPMTPPLFDCSNGVAPESPYDRDAIAGNRMVFDIRTLDVKVFSHVIDMCIPIGT